MENFSGMSDSLNIDNTPNIATTVTTAAVANSGVYVTLVESLPFLWVGLLLCLCSVFFGISKARAKKEKVTVKKCVDGFIGKVIKYSCWSLLGCSFAWAFQVMWLKYFIIGAVYLIELDGIYDNFCESKEIENKLHFSGLLNIFRKGGDLIKKKEEEIVEDEEIK